MTSIKQAHGVKAGSIPPADAPSTQPTPPTPPQNPVAVEKTLKSVVFDESHKYTLVATLDERGSGGANHMYLISVKPEYLKPGQATALACIDFQNGPIKENGINGVMDENLLSIVANRLEGFQSGPYACDENQEALESIQHALSILRNRTARREKAGVEGTHQTAPGDAAHEEYREPGNSETAGQDLLS